MSESHRRCSGSCMCTCHHRRSKETPHFLKRFFGILFLGYTGFPLITPPCDIHACIRRPTAVITYFFPSWLITRVFLMVMRVSLHDGPQISIRVPRVISGSSKIFYSAKIGDVDSIKEILQQRIGSPFDVDYFSGYTALMVRTAFQT